MREATSAKWHIFGRTSWLTSQNSLQATFAEFTFRDCLENGLAELPPPRMLTVVSGNQRQALRVLTCPSQSVKS
jgi:hypothetical protein